ncbi:uncharacterized protein LOC108740787 [Agrilus planipennis]|uniref:Uncharacterized protein LOC108740787 n=1 Tax=Agrilus planipennis TaxID=224129 RepID=A0A1W4X3R4_AGRPL|nr:uncharacterized protein LOC108740787 [Agrilus planipennis]XP_025836016.1 uncharacterized protein LOC108740787 [Agrilus planipennis]
MKQLLILFLLAPFCFCVSDWQPVLPADVYRHTHSGVSSATEPPSYSRLIAQQYKQPALDKSIASDQCELHKVGFTQDLYFQYIQYKIGIPELKEFTLCYWSKFYNHSNDHPVFSYAVENQPRAILAWVSNTERSSYYSLSVHGHTLYRLNYPLRMNRWYHSCQSWNGRTGEWQIWVNAERVGRGFLNRLVDHKIPSGGIAITGQEQTQYGGGFIEGDYAPKGAGGMLGEITMLQLYKVALTAGKAHRDHKHHHGQLYDHDGNLITTTPLPLTSPRSTLPPHPLLIGGQLNPEAAFEIASSNLPGKVPQHWVTWNFVHNPFFPHPDTLPGPPGRGPQLFFSQPSRQASPAPSNTRPLILTGNSLQKPQTQSLLQQQLLQNSVKPLPATPILPTPGPSLLSGELFHSRLSNPASVQFIDKTQLETHQLFKREHKKDKEVENLSIEDDKEFGMKLSSKRKTKRQGDNSEETVMNGDSDESNESSDSKKKRQLFVGSFSDNDYLGDTPTFELTFEQSLQYGLAGIGHNVPIMQQQRKEDDREPAEAEVTAVMNVCSGCEEEPFERALILSWRSVPKKLYSGAYYLPAQTQCRLF